MPMSIHVSVYVYIRSRDFFIVSLFFYFFFLPYDFFYNLPAGFLHLLIAFRGNVALRWLTEHGEGWVDEWWVCRR
jgi:hypothetical protein